MHLAMLELHYMLLQPPASAQAYYHTPLAISPAA